jgi:predicted molibdopterin-dependent oxidoreductase YjgC
MVGIVDDPAVLDEPLIRDPHGRLVPVDWDTALGDLAEKLSLIQDSCEPYAIPKLVGVPVTLRVVESRA